MKLMKIIEEIMEIKYIDNEYNLLREQLEHDMNNKKTDITPDEMSEINEIRNKFGAYYGRWLIQRVSRRDLKGEDIYKYANFFQYFIDGKSLGHFSFSDIGKYNNRNLVMKFEQEAIKSHEEIAQIKGEKNDSESSLVSPSQINTLKNVGIDFLGITKNGYQVFKIPQELNGNVKAWKIYKNILGRCHGKEISICTMGNFSRFNKYTETDDLYVFFNLKDSNAPYQFHYDEKQFKDRNDKQLV